jgi:hypothetical protein
MRQKQALACAAVFAVILSGPSLAQDLDWGVYWDEQHGCRLDYPQALFVPDPADPAEPGEPQRFSGIDESIYFRVMGAENISKWTPQDIKDKYLRANMPGDITYQRTRDEFLVLSGYRDDSIFYTKVAISGDQRIACILDINYPRSAKKDFDTIVTRMSRSFRVVR